MKKQTRMQMAIVVGLVACLTLTAPAKDAPVDQPKPAIELGVPFGDNAVLQREMKVPVWGWSKPGVKILASTQASSNIALHTREDLATIPSVGVAGKKAFEVAGKSPADIDLCEIHDCFTIAEIVVAEELGFAERGKGGLLAESGESAIGGRIPINTSGGLKSKGHPVGASGVAQIVEAVKQLRGDAGDRQVAGAKVAMTQNMGGTGASCVCHILEVN